MMGYVGREDRSTDRKTRLIQTKKETDTETERYIKIESKSEREREKKRKRETQTERQPASKSQTERDTERYTDIQKKTQTERDIADGPTVHLSISWTKLLSAKGSIDTKGSLQNSLEK